MEDIWCDSLVRRGRELFVVVLLCRQKQLVPFMEHFPRGEYASDGVFYCCLVSIESVRPMEPEEQGQARVYGEYGIFASVDRRSVRFACSPISPKFHG